MSDLTVRLKRGPSPSGAPGRALSVAGALGGAQAALTSLAVMLALGLTAWYLADAGAHGQTTDALRVGADTWLVGHGSRITLSGLPIGIVPLGLTVMFLLGAYRRGRKAAQRAAEVTEDGSLAAGVAAFVGAYLVVTVIVAVMASQSGATVSLGRAGLGAVGVSVLGGGLGLAVGTGRAAHWLAPVPVWVKEVAAGAVSGALTVIAAGAVLAGVALLFSFDEAANVLSDLGLSTGEALSYTFVMALLAPNVALFGSTYLLGPGFAVGVGTSVSPSAVTLGAVPAVPFLAALPPDGPAPGWLKVLLVVPVLAAAIGTAKARTYADDVAYDVAALRGAGSGVGAGLLITVLIALAGGPMGTGRLADIGAPIGDVLVFATGLMTLGGLLGGLVAARWSRRGVSAESD
ncbi:MAG TPA: DUF6350 family protein [Marmoricola sp.]|nr:DUF6350 family protein [Marmoricola sp.]